MKYLKKINESIDSKDITIISGNDWSGIYHNGELITQGHSINYDDVLEHLGYNIKSVYIDDDEWWEELGSCPQDLEEVKLKLDTEKYNL